MVFKSFFFIFIIVLLVIFLVNCRTFLSLKPWRTIEYSSINFENHSFNYKQFVELSSQNPERVLDNVYLYITTHATNETLYDGVDPYCITFCFWTYDGTKDILINDIEMLNTDLPRQDKYDFENTISLSTEYHEAVNTMTMEMSTSEYSIGSYSTPYVFNLQNYEEDSINTRIRYTIDSRENDIVISLKRYERKGLFQHQY